MKKGKIEIEKRADLVNGVFQNERWLVKLFGKNKKDEPQWLVFSKENIKALKFLMTKYRIDQPPSNH